jgi:hypothetical protein
MPVRPSVEGKLMMRSEEVKVMGSGLLAAWSSRKKLIIWAAYCAWRAALTNILNLIVERTA